VSAILGENFKSAKSVLASDTFGYSDQSALVKYDPQAAKKILDDAGWVPGPNGIRNKGGVACGLP
jgi:peptide/nickel transport system substrate-binding protein